MMKALKSQLATELLADPKARGDLRRFIVTKRGGTVTRQAEAEQFQINRSSGDTFKAVVVPKAKAA
jgi:hypothetical protein